MGCWIEMVSLLYNLFSMWITAHLSRPNSMQISLLNLATMLRCCSISSMVFMNCFIPSMYSRLLTNLFSILYPTFARSVILVICASARQNRIVDSVSSWNIPFRDLMYSPHVHPFSCRRDILVLHDGMMA